MAPKGVLIDKYSLAGAKKNSLL